jgi:site-specific DNA recombinase
MLPSSLPLRNTVLAVRVSTPGQGIDGDSPEAQIEQGQRYAPLHNMVITKILTYLESASGDIQPMQHVIDYAINPKNSTDVVLIKSIDRFTRGGSTAYDLLKRQLEPHNIDLEDMYGVISNVKVNTLEHLGVQYKWSVHTPSRKTELLEAERAKDEVRDILTRMIGSEIRYTQLGYWSREAPYGLRTKKVESPNGKRAILIEKKKQGPIIKRMYELRAEGILSDDQIAEEMNRMGFQTQTKYVRDKEDRTKVVRTTGGKLMTAKLLRSYVRRTIYAGVNTEKWTGEKPVQCRFNSLIKIELFNAANRGRIAIRFNEADPEHPIVERAAKNPKFVKKNVYNNDFPYRKMISCPRCEHLLLGSTSHGRYGKPYPAYHCSHHGHFYRVRKADFDASIHSFVERVTVSPERFDEVAQAVLTIWEKRKGQAQQQEEFNTHRKEDLEDQMHVIVNKMKIISSETAIKYMEEDLLRLEQQVKDLDAKKEEKAVQETIDIPKALTYVRYFVEHMKDLLIDHCNPVLKAKYFGVLFDKVPTFATIDCGSTPIAEIPEVNELFKLAHNEKVSLVRMRGLEPPRLTAPAPKTGVSTIPPHPRRC